MALPSQSERSTTHRPVHTQNGRKGPNKGVAVAAMLLLAAGAVYAIYRFTPKSTTGADGTKLASNDPAKPAAKPATPGGATGTPPAPRSLLGDKGTTPQPPPAPVTLTQGAGGSVEQGGPNPGALGNALGDKQGTTPPAPGGDGRPPAVDVTRDDLTAQPKDPATGSGGSGNAGTPAGTPNAPVNPLPSAGSPAGVRAMIEAGERDFASGKLVEARVNFSRAYLNAECGPADQSNLRERLTAINNDLMFSPKVTPNDPLVRQHTVQAGDMLERIRKKNDLAIDWRLIARVNGMANPNNLKVGQKIKLPLGPFHAVVHKGDFRMDLFAGSPDEPERWTYIRSFRVGLGEAGKSDTPVGTFKIRNKMANPAWKNPQTGEQFSAEDPKNPIGEYWLGWEGLGDSKVYTRYGLHGTIDPSSIGQQKSMGCVRLANDDIALAYEMLTEQVSLVKVLP